MNVKTLIIALFVSILLGSCIPIQAFIPITPTPTSCPYAQNPGPPPPAVVNKARVAFNELGSKGIRGTLNVGADGEYSCDRFGVMAVNFEYTLIVNDLEDQATLEKFASTVTKSARDSVKGWNLGTIRIRFISGKECRWDDAQKTCTPIVPISAP